MSKATLTLDGLTVRPSQVWGSVRLVPLVREKPIEDLRLHPKLYDDELSIVEITPREFYVSYIPHAFVATWTSDGTPAAAYGTTLQKADEKDPAVPACIPLKFRRHMARRVDRERLRFMPLHLAMEGYLDLHFGGPSVVWEEWSHRAVSRGLSPRCEEAYSGAEIQGLDDALRIFEIHPGQCGVLVYVADALAGAFVVPHPDDYRALHSSLLMDMYGELLYTYGQMTLRVQESDVRLPDGEIRSLPDLRASAARADAEWAGYQLDVMAAGLLGDRSYAFDTVYRMGPFTLSRFLPSFELRRENHIGEVVTDRAGGLAYLKTFRLSEAQVRRGYLLTRIAEHDWNLAAAAKELGTSEAQLGVRLERAGFGFLLRQDVLDRYRAERRARAHSN